MPCLAKLRSRSNAPRIARINHAAPTEPGDLTNPIEVSFECNDCHRHPDAPEDASDPPYAPFGAWEGSLMGNAARDPVCWGAMALAAQDDPAHTEDCIRCHAPAAYLDGRGGITEARQLLEPDVGIDCDVCRRMVADESTPRGNARYTMSDDAILVLGPHAFRSAGL